MVIITQYVAADEDLFTPPPTIVSHADSQKEQTVNGLDSERVHTTSSGEASAEQQSQSDTTQSNLEQVVGNTQPPSSDPPHQPLGDSDVDMTDSTAQNQEQEHNQEKRGVANSHHVCVICSKDTISNYTSRSFLQDYKECFPNFDGSNGVVCPTCYSQCHAFRKRKQLGGIEMTATKAKSAAASGKRPRGRPRKSDQLNASTDRVSATPEKAKTPRSSTPSSSTKKRTKVCCCCDEQIDQGTKSYNYAPFRKEYGILFPSSLQHSSRRVCPSCYQKCQRYVQEKDDGGDMESEERAAKRARLSPMQGAPLISSSNDVHIFIEYKFVDCLEAVSHIEDVADGVATIRCTVSPTLSISSLKQQAQSNLNSLLSSNNFTISTCRRKVQDSLGNIFEETLHRDDVLSTYPLADRERITFFVRMKDASQQTMQEDHVSNNVTIVDNPVPTSTTESHNNYGQEQQQQQQTTYQQFGDPHKE